MLASVVTAAYVGVAAGAPRTEMEMWRVVLCVDATDVEARQLTVLSKRRSKSKLSPSQVQLEPPAQNLLARFGNMHPHRGISSRRASPPLHHLALFELPSTIAAGVLIITPWPWHLMQSCCIAVDVCIWSLTLTELVSTSVHAARSTRPRRPGEWRRPHTVSGKFNLLPLNARA